MEILLIVVGVVIVVAVVAAVLVTPMLNKKGDAAVDRAKELIGGTWILLEPKVVGLGTEPEDADGPKGMGCLAVSADKLAFVTWAPQRELVIDRSSITLVDTEADDAGSVQKTTIQVHFPSAEGDTIAKFRVGKELHDWLDELGYEWGPEGRPVAPVSDDTDDDD